MDAEEELLEPVFPEPVLPELVPGDEGAGVVDEVEVGLDELPDEVLEVWRER